MGLNHEKNGGRKSRDTLPLTSCTPATWLADMIVLDNLTHPSPPPGGLTAIAGGCEGVVEPVTTLHAHLWQVTTLYAHLWQSHC